MRQEAMKPMTKPCRKTDETERERTDGDPPRPKLDKTDPFAGRFREISRKDSWVPGLVEIVFKDPTRSGVRSWHFPDEKERKEYSEAWPDDLKDILRANDLVSWKPSFPQRYPW